MWKNIRFVAKTSDIRNFSQIIRSGYTDCKIQSAMNLVIRLQWCFVCIVHDQLLSFGDFSFSMKSIMRTANIHPNVVIVVYQRCTAGLPACRHQKQPDLTSEKAR